ncbi:RNA polymerase sigma factor [Elongatibacter sediminis]|uniref:Sigma-70 family RNA polymerase sigma factor n=1 Tax=Elongatibacter sediminis TaxID=3119006 RepID=A0AAW9R7S4_9GAMM
MKPAADTPSASPPSSGIVDLKERNWLPRHARGEAGAFDELLAAYRTLVLTLLVRWGVPPQHRDDVFQDVFLKIHLAAASYRPGEPLKPWLVSIVLNTVRNHRRDSGRHRHAMNRLEAGAIAHTASVTGGTGTTATAERQASPPARSPRRSTSGPAEAASADADQFRPASSESATSGPERPGSSLFDSAPLPAPLLPHGEAAESPEARAERQATAAWLEQRIGELPRPQRDVLVFATVKGLRMKEIAAALQLPENTVKTHLRRARLALAEALAERDQPTTAITPAAGESGGETGESA